MRWVFFFLFPFCVFANHAEELLKKMSLEEKIGQLFVAPACPLGGEKHRKDLLEVLHKYSIGGVIFKQSDAKTQVDFLRELQEESSFPLLVLLDAEWGLGMRVTDGLSFPRNLTLGAIQDESLLFLLGKEIGKECRAIGGHINLAPVVDVNCNPLNPIIHMRSFGENPLDVSRKSILVMKGMQEGGILTSAKHFPGHGDTAEDSHLDMPSVMHPWERLEEVELYPFRKLIEAGVDSVLSAHLSVPALEDLGLPSTLSRAIMHDLLSDKMGFQGLVISDALNMQALIKYFTPTEIATLAYEAGNDLLLYGDHIAPNIEKILHEEIPQAFTALLKAFKEGRLDKRELDKKVLKILSCKLNVGLFQEESPIDLSKVHSEEGAALRDLLFEEAITLVKNEGLLPLTKESAVLSIGDVFQGKGIHLSMDASENEMKEAKAALKGASEIVIALGSLYPYLPQYGLNAGIISLIQELREKAKVILVVFGTPYVLRYVDGDAILIAYEEEKAAERAAWRVLTGEKHPTGKLPVTCGSFSAGLGITFRRP